MAFDFDNFDEEAALKDAAALVGVKTGFGDGKFHGRFADGTELSVPLDVPLKLIDFEASETDPAGTIVTILEGIGLQDEAEALTEKSFIGALLFAQKYFEALEKVFGAALGKSSS